MNHYWVRKQGQAELRDNLRTAIRQSGRSQREVIDEAGVGYSHVTGGLSGNNWITVEAVEAVAAVLEISPEELLGNSIYKHERTRYVEFASPPPEVLEEQRQEKAATEAREAARALAAGGEDRTRALCCTCGSLRTATWTGFEFDPRWDAYNRGRMLVELQCFVCDEQTEHAVLLAASDDSRDAAEIFDHTPTREQQARGDLERLIRRLAEFSVDVHYRQWGKRGRRDCYVVRYQFDESKSRWRIELEERVSAVTQVNALETAWKAISTDDHDEGVDWDPREGVTLAANDSAWSTAVDALMEDVNRFLDVERRKLIRDVHDRAALVDAESSRDEEADR